MEGRYKEVVGISKMKIKEAWPLYGNGENGD